MKDLSKKLLFKLQPNKFIDKRKFTIIKFCLRVVIGFKTTSIKNMVRKLKLKNHEKIGINKIKGKTWRSCYQ